MRQSRSASSVTRIAGPHRPALADDEGLAVRPASRAARVDLRRRSAASPPIFCTTTASCVSGAGIFCASDDLFAAERNRVRELDQRVAGRERAGHRDLARPPRRRSASILRASPRRPRPPAARTRAAASVCTGRFAVLTICRRLKTFSASSPTSITKRLCSPSTTSPGTGGPCASVRSAAAFCSIAGVGRDEHQRACRRRPARRTPATRRARRRRSPRP